MSDTLPMLQTSAPTELARLIGTRLNGFVITGTVSMGGMGVVYEARHPLIGRRAAVKVIRPELRADGELSARFLREARALSAVKHRNVVEILDYGALPDGTPYMMMEFLEGDTLAQAIAARAPMPPREALALCEEILAGLSAAHQVGVVHRDLKPANIVLLEQSGGELNVKVLDFGLARQLDTAPEPTTRESLRSEALEKSSLLAGTPEYMSPEQVSGKQVGAQGDLYALGVILFEMLSGHLPFVAATAWELMQQQRLSAPPSLQALQGASAPLSAFVQRLLAKDPADRPLGAREAAKEIAALLPLFDAAPVADTLLLNRSVELGWQRLPPRPALIGAALLVSGVAIAMTFVGSTPPHDDARSDSPSPGAARAAQATGWKAAPPPEAPVAQVAALLPVRPRARAASPVPPAQGLTCEPSPGWKKAMREQLEDIEKLSLARLRDDASPTEVAQIKGRARGLSASVREASGRDCGQVEAQLRSWRGALQ